MRRRRGGFLDRVTKEFGKLDVFSGLAGKLNTRSRVASEPGTFCGRGKLIRDLQR